jgi:hypothetical protein
MQKVGHVETQKLQDGRNCIVIQNVHNITSQSLRCQVRPGKTSYATEVYLHFDHK